MREGAAVEGQGGEAAGPVARDPLLVPRLVTLLLLAVTVAGFWWARHQGWVKVESVRDMAVAAGPLGPVVYAGIYALFVVLLVPTLPMNLGAGVLWGPWMGTVVSILGAGTGAVIAFLLARTLGREVAEGLRASALGAWLDRAIARFGWKAVAFTRLNPVFPFGPVNYYFGLTPVRLREFAWTTVGFTLPPSFAFAWTGSEIGGFVLDGQAAGVLRTVMVVSAAVTVVTLARLALARDLDVDEAALQAAAEGGDAAS